MAYKHILLVTDLKNDADIVAKKAKAIIRSQNSAPESTSEKTKLSILHIVQDTMVGFGYELVPVASLYEVDEKNQKVAKEQMISFIERNQLSPSSNSNEDAETLPAEINAEVSTAISNAEGIIKYCDTHEVDLVVIGRHERHGWSALINGSTADNIMPDIHCDILVVHLDV